MATVKLEYEAEFFSVKDTLECGQVFRFIPYKKGYAVFSRDKTAYAYNENGKAYVECESADKEYFINYFDLNRDYSKIYEYALSLGVDVIGLSARLGKGIRLLNQDREETLFSFIVSQNNNIPRIKKIIENLCFTLGEEKRGFDYTYHAFPSALDMSKAPIELFYSFGLGYRAPYVKELGELIANGLRIDDMNDLSAQDLRGKLLNIKGVGPKVCDCVMLFGFKRTASFPVDTWIEKVYIENMNGREKDRVKIAKELTERFKENSGYIQQYLFYYKRTLEKNKN